MIEQTNVQVSGALPGEVCIGRAAYRPVQKVGKIRHFLKFLGPAFIVSVAYIDPGNFVLEH